jgi:hypothetical protein
MKSPHQNVLLNLPADPAERKGIPIMTGVLDYFPAAIAEIAKISKLGNDQHNPGQPLHWAREKSTDQADTIIRHLMARGTRDTDGARHSAKAAWRALALLQEELEAEEDFKPAPTFNVANDLKRNLAQLKFNDALAKAWEQTKPAYLNFLAEHEEYEN